MITPQAVGGGIQPLTISRTGASGNTSLREYHVAAVRCVSDIVVFRIGYIGGTALDHVYKAHPDYDYTLLVRDEKRGEPIKAKYPTAKFIYASLENSDAVRDAAAAADIVIRKCTPRLSATMRDLPSLLVSGLTRT